MNKPKMYLMCGNPGSGKTTFAKKLAKEKGARYLGIDSFYHAFYGDVTTHKNNSEIWLEFFKAILMAQREGVDIVVDTNAPDHFKRHDFIAWFDFDIHLYAFEKNNELCLKNNQMRERVIPNDQMIELLNKFEMPDEDEYDWYKEITFIKNHNNEYLEFNKIK